MKTLLLIISLIATQICTAQTAYKQAMQESLQLWHRGQTQEAMSKMERIASVEKDNWIPRYYQALIATLSSFQTTEITQKNTLLKIANDLIPQDKNALNAEWHVLKATILTSELTIDPMNNAMRLSPLIVANYEKAIIIDPNNPRAIAGLATFQIQRKKYTGGNTDQDYKNLEKAVSLFETQKNDTAFYPSWGKEQAQAILDSNPKK